MPKRRGILSRITEALDLPREMLPGGFFLALSGREERLVRGCREILGYEPACITLALPRGRLLVRGEGLFCSAFGGGSVTVCGEIRTLDIEEG